MSHLSPDLWPVGDLPKLLGLVLPEQNHTNSNFNEMQKSPGYSRRRRPCVSLFHHSCGHTLHNRNLLKLVKTDHIFTGYFILVLVP